MVPVTVVALAILADTVDANDAEDWLSVASLFLNVAQTCFLAWLAVWAKHRP